jgi:hypothetical protein
MRTIVRSILYVFSAPADLLAVLLGLFVRLVWGTELSAREGCLFVFVKHSAWLTQFMDRRLGAKWGGSTIGHVILLRVADKHTVGSYERVLAHELIHVEQFEAHALLGLVAGLALAPWAWWLGLIVWVLMPALAYLAAMLVAVLRGEASYRGNHLEEAAYDGARR